MIKIYQRIFCCLLLFLLPCAALFSQTKVIPYQQLPTSTGGATGSNIYFGATMTTSVLTVTFEGPSDRWFALGLGAGMASPTDVLMYGNGITSSIVPVGWYDYYNDFSSTAIVNLDPVQNWTIVSTGTTSAGQRTVVAARDLNTGDASYDIVVNYTATTFSLVWARGATADYTIAYHGTTGRADGISLTWLSQPTASFSAPTTTVCEGSALTFTNLTTGGLTSYNWSFGSGSPATSTLTNPSITYSVPGTYSVALTASNAIGTSTYTQINYITVTPTVASAVSIAQSGGTNPMCGGVPAIFTAAPLNGGSAPVYQWKVNGVNAGAGGTTFATSALNTNATISCVMSPNFACAVPAAPVSAPVTVTVNSSAPASTTVTIAGGGNPTCNGSLSTFFVTPGNGGSSPSYQWQINGGNVGTNNATFTTTSLANGDVLTCVLASNAVCASATVGISAPITITVSTVLTPSVSFVLSSGTNPSCAGSQIIFTATPVNGGTAPSYQWKINNTNVGANNSSFSTSALTTNNVVTCIMNSNSQCANPTTASVSTTFTIFPIPPVPTISAPGSHTVCSGNTLTLTSSATSGNVWSTSASTQSILATTTGNYSVKQSLNGCTSAPSAVLHASFIALPATPLISASGSLSFCLGDSVTLGSSFAMGNSWSTSETTQSIVVKSSGSYSLTKVGGICNSLPGVVNVTVYSVPNPTVVPPGLICKDMEPIDLEGDPSGGAFAGSGIVGNSFDPAFATIGSNNIVVYTYYKDFGGAICEDTTAIRLIVTDCTGINEIQKENSGVSVYPNPATGKFTIEAKLKKINRIRVIDISGKQILDQTINNGNKTNIDLEHYASGVYILEVQLDSKIVRTRIRKTE